MKKLKWSLFLAITVVMLYGLTSTVFADTNITAHHQLVSRTEGANGFDISLSFTIENKGAEALSNVTLELVDPMLTTTDPDTSSYSPGNLPSEVELPFFWNTTSACCPCK